MPAGQSYDRAHACYAVRVRRCRAMRNEEVPETGAHLAKPATRGLRLICRRPRRTVHCQC